MLLHSCKLPDGALVLGRAPNGGCAHPALYAPVHPQLTWWVSPHSQCQPWQRPVLSGRGFPASTSAFSICDVMWRFAVTFQDVIYCGFGDTQMLDDLGHFYATLSHPYHAPSLTHRGSAHVSLSFIHTVFARLTRHRFSAKLPFSKRHWGVTGDRNSMKSGMVDTNHLRYIIYQNENSK